MGNGCFKNANPQSVINPVNQVQTAINQELTPFLSLDNPYNVNHKYGLFFDIIRDKSSGTGIKHTLAYRSKIPINEIEKKRIEFWETRVEGNIDAWQALRGACEATEEDAIAILGAMGLKLVNKSLQIAYDSRGYKYDVPIFCINPPVSYDLPKNKELKKEDVSSSNIHVKLRNVGAVTDIDLTVANNIATLELKEEYIKKSGSDLKPDKLRFFFGGKELQDSHLIAEYGVKDGLVIQVFKKK